MTFLLSVLAAAGVSLLVVLAKARLFLSLVSLALLALLIAAPTNAGTYGYNGYHGHNFSYYPTLPTYQSYGYQNYYQPYYAPSYSYGYSYSYPTYSAPAYSSSGTNYKDGNYHYHAAGTYQGVWYPAGNYSWQSGQWVGQNSQLATPVAPDDWKQTFLKVASKRDEYAAYLAALKAMGVSPPPAGGFAPPPGIGSGPGYGNGSGVNYNTNLGTYGANGSTLYGYTVQSVKDMFGDASTASLYLQAQQLAQNAQALGGEATKQFQSNVAQDSQNRTRMAEALARGLAASEALRAAQGSESHQSSSTTTFQSGQGVQQQQQMPPQGNDQQGAPQQQTQPRLQGAARQPSPAFVVLATKSCLKCHDGSKADGNKLEGGFAIQSYSAMPLKDKMERVFPRLITGTDDKPRMPKGHEPLTPEELKLFLEN